MMAFENCDNLESFIIPENVEEIPMMLVAYSDNLSYLYIPANVKTVGLSAFSNCKSLTMINSAIVNIDLVEFKESYGGNVEAFKNIPETCTWRVPCGTTEKYTNQPWWVKTWKIIEDCTDAISNVKEDLSAISYDNGILTIVSKQNGNISIYSINGMLIRNIIVKSGETYHINLSKGTYIVNNKKIILK